MGLGKLKIAVSAVLLVLCMAKPSLAAGIEVWVDGKPVTLSVAPVVQEGRTLVPIAPIAHELGGDASYDSATKTVRVVTVDNEIQLTLGSKTAVVNGSNKTIDVAAQAINGRTMVPLRFVAEALGTRVEYNDKEKTVEIKYFSDMQGTLKIGGSTTVQPITQRAADELMKINKGLSVSVAGGGSGEGVKGTDAGTFNIGNVSRDLEDADKKSYPSLNSYAIGADALVVIVNPKNPVNDLTKQQVVDIFTGKIKNWKEVGGPDAAIFVQTREPGSGTLTAFEELALQKKAKVVATATPHTSNGLVKQAVANNVNSIGFLSMGYLDKTVKATKIDGVSALKSKAISREWPYVRGLNVVTKGKPTGLSAKFINYLRSPKGQAIVSENYLPLRAED